MVNRGAAIPADVVRPPAERVRRGAAPGRWHPVREPAGATRNGSDGTGRAAGRRRWTRQRQVVLDTLRGAHGHLDADEVYRRARQVEPRLSLSTVYRTLAMLKEDGLVRGLHLAGNQHRYECLPPPGAPGDHGHLACRVCGSVVEFAGPDLARLEESLARRYGYEFTGAQIEIVARCADCQAAPVPAPATIATRASN
ncbi:MAG TPA: transcriptional repressor [Chloroflexota bacterium]|nr:transcriptional repressor [Chloroflexota bacterium]